MRQHWQLNYFDLGYSQLIPPIQLGKEPATCPNPPGKFRFNRLIALPCARIAWSKAAYCVNFSSPRLLRIARSYKLAASSNWFLQQDIKPDSSQMKIKRIYRLHLNMANMVRTVSFDGSICKALLNNFSASIVFDGSVDIKQFLDQIRSSETNTRRMKSTDAFNANNVGFPGISSTNFFKYSNALSFRSLSK